MILLRLMFSQNKVQIHITNRNCFQYNFKYHKQISFVTSDKFKCKWWLIISGNSEWIPQQKSWMLLPREKILNEPLITSSGLWFAFLNFYKCKVQLHKQVFLRQQHFVVVLKVQKIMSTNHHQKSIFYLVCVILFYLSLNFKIMGCNEC